MRALFARRLLDSVSKTVLKQDDWLYLMRTTTKRKMQAVSSMTDQTNSTILLVLHLGESIRTERNKEYRTAKTVIDFQSHCINEGGTAARILLYALHSFQIIPHVVRDARVCDRGS